MTRLFPPRSLRRVAVVIGLIAADVVLAAPTATTSASAPTAQAVTRSVAEGLGFLSSRQLADGHFSASQHRLAEAAMAAEALLAAGVTPGVGTHGLTLRRAVDALAAPASATAGVPATGRALGLSVLVRSMEVEVDASRRRSARAAAEGLVASIGSYLATQTDTRSKPADALASALCLDALLDAKAAGLAVPAGAMDAASAVVEDVLEADRQPKVVGGAGGAGVRPPRPIRPLTLLCCAAVRARQMLAGDGPESVTSNTAADARLLLARAATRTPAGVDRSFWTIRHLRALRQADPPAFAPAYRQAVELLLPQQRAQDGRFELLAPRTPGSTSAPAQADEVPLAWLAGPVTSTSLAVSALSAPSGWSDAPLP